MLLSILAYTFYKAQFRTGSIVTHWGPLLFVALSFPLIMADPMRHLLQDQNAWPAPGSSEYRSGCHDETVRCLSVMGVFFYNYHDLFGVFLPRLWHAVEREFSPETS